MHAAIFRNSRHDLKENERPSSLPVFHPSERLSFTETIGMYTSGAAYAAGEDDRLGQLKPNFRADFVVVNLPVWETNNVDDTAIDGTWHLLRNVQVQEVWVDGQQRLKH
jgi:predicted amidohydrolase YtcJ